MGTVYHIKDDVCQDIVPGHNTRKMNDGLYDIHVCMSIYCQSLGEKQPSLSQRRKEALEARVRKIPGGKISCVLKAIKGKYLKGPTVSP